MYSADKLDIEIKRADHLARDRDLVGALDLASPLITEYPQDVRVWLLRAYLFMISPDNLSTENHEDQVGLSLVCRF